MSTQKQVRVLLKDYVPAGAVKASHFEVVHTDLDTSSIPEGGALVQLMYVSVDPYLRGRLRPGKSYVPPFVPGQPPDSGAVLKVLESRSDKVAVGDYLTGRSTWESISIVGPKDLAALQKVDAKAGVPLSYYIGSLGMPGMTAYASIKKIAKPVAGEKAFVSGAAGAVGQLAGQLLKNVYGVSVIGSAGSADKVALLKSELGFDAAFNYKEASTAEEVKAFAPDGLNIYFDNVGGETLDAALLNMAPHGRIVACGSISQYDSAPEERYGVKNMFSVVTQRLNIQGFIVGDFAAEVGPDFKKDMLKYILDGKIKVKEHVVQGLENVGQAFADLMAGKNIGKMVVQCAEDATRKA